MDAGRPEALPEVFRPRFSRGFFLFPHSTRPPCQCLQRVRHRLSALNHAHTHTDVTLRDHVHVLRSTGPLDCHLKYILDLQIRTDALYSRWGYGFQPYAPHAHAHARTTFPPARCPPQRLPPSSSPPQRIPPPSLRPRNPRAETRPQFKVEDKRSEPRARVQADTSTAPSFGTSQHGGRQGVRGLFEQGE